MNTLRKILSDITDAEKRREISDYFNSNPTEFRDLLNDVFGSSDSGYTEDKRCILDLVDLLSTKLVIETVVKALADDDVRIRIKGLQATYRRQIDSLNDMILRILNNVDEPFEIRKWAVHILGGTDPVGFGRHLRQIMRNPEEDVNLRKEAIFARTNNASVETLGTLCILLGDRNSEIRQSSAWALSKIGSEDSISCLLAALEDDDESVREWAIRGLRDIDSSRALQGLADSMVRAQPKEQVQFIRLVAEKKSEIIMRAIAVLLESYDVSVRRSAAWAMGVSPYPPAAGTLEKLIKDDDSEVREYAKKALARLGLIDSTDFGLVL